MTGQQDAGKELRERRAGERAASETWAPTMYGPDSAVRRFARLAQRYSWLLRLALTAYVLLLACPIRYWKLESGPDSTWRFALNYAAAHGYAAGRELCSTPRGRLPT